MERIYSCVVAKRIGGVDLLHRLRHPFVVPKVKYYCDPILGRGTTSTENVDLVVVSIVVLGRPLHFPGVWSVVGAIEYINVSTISRSTQPSLVPWYAKQKVLRIE
jgi:hypothetical protein